MPWLSHWWTMNGHDMVSAILAMAIDGPSLAIDGMKIPVVTKKSLEYVQYPLKIYPLHISHGHQPPRKYTQHPCMTHKTRIFKYHQTNHFHEINSENFLKFLRKFTSRIIVLKNGDWNSSLILEVGGACHAIYQADNKKCLSQEAEKRYLNSFI